LQIHLTVAGCSIQLTSLSPHPVLVIVIGIGCIVCIGGIGGIDIGIGNDDAAGIGIGGIVRIGGIGIGIGIGVGVGIIVTVILSSLLSSLLNANGEKTMRDDPLMQQLRRRRHIIVAIWSASPLPTHR
jgi:hypothetical protein